MGYVNLWVVSMFCGG